VLESALKARAQLAPRLPEVRAAVTATTASVRRLRGGLAVARVAAGLFDIGRAVRQQLTVAAAEQLLQQQAADDAALEEELAGQLQQRLRRERRRVQQAAAAAASTSPSPPLALDSAV
jgi:exonuclease VII large subunit